MDFIKSQYDRIQQQLSGLTPSQKMLSGALVVIMIMTLLWWGRFAATPDYAPILAQGLTPEEITQIAGQLKSAGIDHQVAGNQILVPPGKMYDALAFVGYAEAMPKTITSGFDEIIKQLTPWDGMNRQDAIFNHGKELTLQRIISRFPGVATATVVIDPSGKFQLERDTDATASVSVTMKDSTASSHKRLAMACAHMVAGAQVGLKPAKVTVTIDGKLFPTGEDGMSGGLANNTILEVKAEAEQLAKRKLQEALGFIEGLHVSITVDVDTTTRSIESLKFDKANSFGLEKKTTSSSTEETNSPPAGGEAGVSPNSGVSANQPVGTSGFSSGRSHSQDSTEFENEFSRSRTQETKPAGDCKVVGALVRVPRSYIVREASEGDLKAEPTSAKLQETAARVIKSIRADVAASTRLDDSAISVDTYTDVVGPPPQMEVVTASSVSGLLGGHVKEIALGGLAIASLFMMSMIVRKGAAAPAPVIATTIPVGPSMLSASEDIAGEAIGQDPALDGLELDDDSIKTQQMLSQVTSLVGESPDTAAQLIKRWMNQR